MDEGLLKSGDRITVLALKSLSLNASRLKGEIPGLENALVMFDGVNAERNATLDRAAM